MESADYEVTSSSETIEPPGEENLPQQDQQLHQQHDQQLDRQHDVDSEGDPWSQPPQLPRDGEDDGVDIIDESDNLIISEHGRSGAARFAKWPQGRAVLAWDYGTWQDVEQDKKSFKTFLESCGLDVQLCTESNLQQLRSKISEGIAGASQAVVLVLRHTDDPKDMDQIADVVKNSNAKQKLLVVCRVCTSGFDNRPQFVCLSPAQRRVQYPNMFIVSMCGIEISAKYFFKDLKKKLEDRWLVESISSILDVSRYKPEELSGWHLYFANALQGNFVLLLQPHLKYLQRQMKDLSMGLRDGGHLKQLEDGLLDRMREEEGEDPMQNAVYSCRGNRKALIINNVRFPRTYQHRTGSLADCQNLVDLLQKLQFDVKVQLDLTSIQLKEEVENFSKDSNPSECCVLVVMSHGRFGEVKGTDGLMVKERDLLELMHSGTVKGKPRLVIFQCCRPWVGTKEVGTGTEEVQDSRSSAEMVGQSYRGTEAPVFVPELLHDQCGLIVAHSTSPGDYSFRSCLKGSRFIFVLCYIFHRFAHKEDVATMIRRVNFHMLHGLGKIEESGMDQEAQLPWWSVQTDKKFFLVRTPERDAEE